MAGTTRFSKPTPVSDLAGQVLDPVLRRRTGMSIALVQSWEEIAGVRLAALTRPERIAWPRRLHEDDPFQPATLVIACEGFAALHVQHEADEIVARANAFLGFGAIGRIRIVQKPVRRRDDAGRKPRLGPVSKEDEARISAAVRPIENEGLRASLEALGRSVVAARNRQR
jgi:hypothetical protein